MPSALLSKESCLDDMVWLNANENPEGPPRSSIEAMSKALVEGGRYHYQEFREFYDTLARTEDLTAEQILVGSGSSEVLHAAVDAFTSPTRPLITVTPTYEGPVDLTRKGLARDVLQVMLEPPYAPDVKQLVAHAAKAGGGLIYLCNPNNPGIFHNAKKRSCMDGRQPAAPKTTLLVDEAYAHFADTPDFESAFRIRASGQERGSDAHFLEDLRDGGTARRIRLRLARTDRPDGAFAIT